MDYNYHVNSRGSPKPFRFRFLCTHGRSSSACIDHPHYAAPRDFLIRVVSLLRFQPSCQPIFPQPSQGLALYRLRVDTVAPLPTYLTMTFFFVLFTLFYASTYFATYSQHDTEGEKTYCTIGVKYSQQLCSQVIIHVSGNLHFLSRFERREAQVRA